MGRATNRQKQTFIVLCLEDFRVNILLQCNSLLTNKKFLLCAGKKKWTENLKTFSKNTYRWWPTDIKRCSTSVIMENANQNYDEVLPHACQNGYHKDHK